MGCAIPIAIASNVTRITLTGLFHELFGKGAADTIYHDVAGWLDDAAGPGVLYIEYELLLRHVHRESQSRPSVERTIEVSPLARRPESPPVTVSRVIPLLAAIFLVVSLGIIQGLWTNRWTVSRELNLPCPSSIASRW